MFSQKLTTVAELSRKNLMTPTEKSRKLFDFHRDVTDSYMQYSESREVYYDILINKLKQNPEARQLLQEAIVESQT